MKAESLILAIVLGTALPISAAQTLETAYRTAGQAVHSAFDSVREVLQTSSAVIQSGRDEVIFGTVLSIDGYILTKASELGEEIEHLTVTVDRDTFSKPTLVAVDPAWDVALIKVDASNLIPVRFAGDEEVSKGTWVVANGATSRSRRRVQVGVIAADSREIPARGGTVLGVSIREGDGRVMVESVSEDSGAEAAGVEAGDRLVSIEGKAISEFQELLDDLKQRRVGEVVTLAVERDSTTLELEVTLKGRVDLFGEEKDRNDAMSGEYSERRTGFPRVIQHDIIGNSRFMGGPVLDLEGRCVGMNIARFSRCETYAIPAKELSEIAERMISEARL